jgi:hypothetical protein
MTDTNLHDVLSVADARNCTISCRQKTERSAFGSHVGKAERTPEQRETEGPKTSSGASDILSPFTSTRQNRCHGLPISRPWQLLVELEGVGSPFGRLAKRCVLGAFCAVSGKGRSP